MRFPKIALPVAFVSLLVVPPAGFAQARDRDVAQYPNSAAMVRQDMRKLWTDHVVWTRDYIIAATLSQPDAPAALNRLMKNQDDIGNAVATFYGDAAGRQARDRDTGNDHRLHHGLRPLGNPESVRRGSRARRRARSRAR